MPPGRCLEGKLAVVTGASGGIGREIALALAASGAELRLAGRNAPALADLAGACGPGAASAAVDFEDEEATERWTTALAEACPRIDVLVHAAGVIALAPIGEAQLADFDRQYRVNVRAPYAVTRALLPLLRSSRGQVIFLNSSAGLTARAGAGQYAATKHALAAVADSLREECNADGVRVTSVFLGRTASAMQSAVHQAEGKAYHPERLVQPGDVAAVVLNALSLPRTAEVTEITMRPLQKPA